MKKQIVLIFALVLSSSVYSKQLNHEEIQSLYEEIKFPSLGDNTGLDVGRVGGIDGGGGNAVVCYDDQDQIESVEMLDLYEGKILYSRLFSELEVSFQQKIEELSNAIYGAGNFDIFNFRYSQVESGLKFLPAGVRLKEIQDSSHIFIPPSCKIEQLANYYNDQNIFVVSDFYSKMDDLNKFALLLHETIYSLERDNGVTNSRYARRVVSHLLSDNFIIENVYEDIDNRNDYICTTNDFSNIGNSPRSTVFYASEESPYLWKFKFTKVNGHRVYSKKDVYFDLEGSNVEFPLHAGDQTAFDGTWWMTGYPTSNFDGNDEVEFVISAGDMDLGGGVTEFMMLKYKGFDPGDSQPHHRITCIKIFVDVDIDPFPPVNSGDVQ